MTSPSTPSPRRRPAAKPAEAQRDSLRIAAIDIGSNSVHMIVAQVDPDGGVTTLWRMKEMVGLGRISFPSQRLSAEAIERAVATLGRFKQAALQRQCEKIVAVATSAVREASNGGDLIQRIRRELKLYVKVVSAKEEARLIYLGVRHEADLGDDPHLIIDIGGGSVEVIVGDEHGAALLESRKLGAARMTAKFVKSDPISKADRKALLAHYEKELGPVLAKVRELEPVKAIGTSGTLENIAAMCGDVDSAGHAFISRKTFEKVYAKLVKTNAADRETIGGLDDQRKEQIVAAATLVDFLFSKLDLKRMHICGSALREGILIDYLNRNQPDMQIRREVPDPRRRSVIDLARKCHWHEAHSTQVARLTMRLWDELRGVHDLPDADRELVEYAALLHDIGWHIGPRRHHKHSAYLILNSDLDRHFTADEVATIACIARHHRKSTPSPKNEHYAALPESFQRVVDVGVALLRIADGLDRSHSSVVRDLKCRIAPKKLTVHLDVKADAELEIWGARRKADWFSKVFGKSLELIEKK